MGNKSSSGYKDPSLHGETRGRSRSFNGLSSKFRRRSKSPPRERSSSLSEKRPPKGGGGTGSGSAKTGQNGVLKSGQNGHLTRRGDVALTQPVVIDTIKSEKEVEDIKAFSRLSTSAPGGKPFYYRSGTPNSKTSTPNSKCASIDSRYKRAPNSTPNKIKNANGNEIETYAESPRLSAAQMRNVSRELFSDHVEDVAKRRGLASLNRDLSLSQASLGLLSSRSKSMSSLTSNDYDYEERCNVGELLSFEDSSKVGELCKSITSRFSSNFDEDNMEPFMRPRTSSAPSTELGQYERRHVVMGTTSAQLRRNVNSPVSSPNKNNSSESVSSEIVQARKMLVSRALKDGENTENPVYARPDLSHRRSSSPVIRSVSPEVVQQGVSRSKSPATSSVDRSVSPMSNRSSSPLSNYGKMSPEKNTGNSGMSALEQAYQQTRINPAKRILPNINEDQILAANMTKSMRKFLLSNSGVNASVQKGKSPVSVVPKTEEVISTESAIRERSNSFSLISAAKQQQQQQQKAHIIHYASKSYDNTPVSTGGDSGFRSRSQSWSSLSRKSTCSSVGQLANVTSVPEPPVSRLMSYSVTSLSELPLEIPSQPQRYLNLEDYGQPDVSFSQDLDAIQNLGMEPGASSGADVCPQCHMPFDKGKKRKLIDSCGHERCYTCMFSKSECPLCNNLVLHRQLSTGSLRGDGRPKLKTNGHFTTYMQTRDGHLMETVQPQTTPKLPGHPQGYRMHQHQQVPAIPAKPRGFHSSVSPTPPPPPPKAYYTPPDQSSRYYSSDSALGSPDYSSGASAPLAPNDDLDVLEELDRDTTQVELNGHIIQGKDSPPPPTPDVAQNDLMTRLGLLLGDRSTPSHGDHHPPQYHHVAQATNQTEETISSIGTSGDATPDRGISDTSPMSTLTASSGSERAAPYLHPNYGSLFPSRDPSSDSMTSLMSTSTGQSISPHTTTQRPHSITTTTPGAIEDLGLFGRRKSPLRRSARATVGHSADGKVRITPIRPPQLHLTPVNFEIPHIEGNAMFVGREWVFREIEMALSSDPVADQPQGVIITGGLGAGKTAIMEQLVGHSCFGDGKGGLVQGPVHRSSVDGRRHNGLNYSPNSTMNTGNKQHLSGSNTSLNYDCLRNLGGQVVGFHYCQADNNLTCMVPEFVHSMAAYLAHSPQLSAYRELLLQDAQLQQTLSLKECIQDPSNSFVKGILEPLEQLKLNGRIECDSCLILIDSLNEAEFHKPDYGDTIASFVVQHISRFPLWLKLVVSVHSAMLEIVKSLPFSRITIDKVSGSDLIARDLQDYVNHRIETSANIKNNMALKHFDAATQGKFCTHIQNLSRGSFLFCKLTLDLIEKGHVVLKSANYKILPVNISEVFLLQFNLKFPSVRSFEKISPILGVCLATLYPLSEEEIFQAVNSGYSERFVSWEDFKERLDVLSGFLHRRRDDTFMFFHPAFREWLIRRDESDNPKFLCDLRHGHALMAFHLSRVVAPLSADKTIELGHHILKAHIYKNVSKHRGYSSRDMQAFWVALSAENLSAALVCQRNIYSPNVKVSRLILLAGANPNTRTDYVNNAPVLCVAAKEGFSDMVALLLEFNANVDAVSDTGMSALCYAASSGHIEILRMLSLRKARICHVDNLGQCAAVHASISGHLEALVYLMQCDWSNHEGQVTKIEAMQQCLICAAAMGHRDLCEYILHASSRPMEGIGLNIVDTLLGETALTIACLNGRKDLAIWLIELGADIHLTNLKSFTPLLCAVEAGKWEIVDMLLGLGSSIEQTDKHGRTPLMIAAYKGHIGVLEMLLSRGASLHQTDKEGLTALCWGCLKGHLHIITSLLDRGSNLHHTDRCGRSPLQLAAFHGDSQVVQYLIDRGANIEHADFNGMRALDRAIDRRNTAVVILFLRKGAKLGQTTWAVAAGKTDVMLLLLNKLMEDGNILYKKNRIKEAAQRYQYALKKFPEEVMGDDYRTFRDLKLNLMLNLSRCKRKLNDCEAAIELSTQALELKPKCFEAFYARARAKRDNRMYTSAFEDLKEALKLAPNNRELQRLLMRVRDECREQARFEGPSDEMDAAALAAARRHEETAL